MGRGFITVLEFLVVISLFSMFVGLIITTNTNDAIISHTEEFAELVRYKGCITEEMYYDVVEGFDAPVDVRFEAVRKPVLANPDSGDTLEFTKDVLSAIESGDGIYRMNIGDEIQVIVRKPSGNYFDYIVGTLSGKGMKDENPVVAIKGGMILNTQYD